MEKNIVACSACYIVYDFSERTPKLLSCGHHFCLMCVRLMEKAGSIECNTCGYRTEVPRDPEWLPTHTDAVWGNLNAKGQPGAFDLDKLHRTGRRSPLWSGKNDLPQDHCRRTNGNKFKETAQGVRLSAASCARMSNGVNPAFQPPTFESNGIAPSSPSYWCHQPNSGNLDSVKGNGSMRHTNESINQPGTSAAQIGSPNAAGTANVVPEDRDPSHREFQNWNLTGNMNSNTQQRSRHVETQTNEPPELLNGPPRVVQQENENCGNCVYSPEMSDQKIRVLEDSSNNVTNAESDSDGSVHLPEEIMPLQRLLLDIQRNENFTRPINFRVDLQGSSYHVNIQPSGSDSGRFLIITIVINGESQSQRDESVEDTQNEADTDEGGDRPDCLAIVPYNDLNVRMVDLSNCYYMDFMIGRLNAGRVVVEIFPDVAPLMSSNFAILCSGKKAMYRGCKVFQVWRNQSIISGDTDTNTGYSGKSALDDGFFEPDDNCLPPRRGMIGMRRLARSPEHQNLKGMVTSQFRILLNKQPRITGLFGRVISGIEFVDRISRLDDGKGYPRKRVIISDCGKLEDF